MKQLTLATLVVLLALAPTVAVAQTDAPPAPTDNNSSTPTALSSVDKLTVITDYELRDGNLWIEFYSEGGNTLKITETTSGDGAVQVAIRQEDIPRGYSTTTVDLISTDDPSVLITTRFSLQEGTGTKLSVDTSSSIVSGPFDGSDAQAAGFCGALGVALTTLYLVAQRVYGRSEQPERIA